MFKETETFYLKVLLKGKFRNIMNLSSTNIYNKFRCK